MEPRDKLTPGNIKLVGVTLALHARLKAEAKAQHVAIHEVIADWGDKAARFDVARAALKNGDGDAN